MGARKHKPRLQRHIRGIYLTQTEAVQQNMYVPDFNQIPRMTRLHDPRAQFVTQQSPDDRTRVLLDGTRNMERRIPRRALPEKRAAEEMYKICLANKLKEKEERREMRMEIERRMRLAANADKKIRLALDHAPNRQRVSIRPCCVIHVPRQEQVKKSQEQSFDDMTCTIPYKTPKMDQEININKRYVPDSSQASRITGIQDPFQVTEEDVLSEEDLAFILNLKENLELAMTRQRLFETRAADEKRRSSLANDMKEKQEECEIRRRNQRRLRHLAAGDSKLQLSRNHATTQRCIPAPVYRKVKPPTPGNDLLFGKLFDGHHAPARQNHDLAPEPKAARKKLPVSDRNCPEPPDRCLSWRYPDYFNLI